MISPRFLIGLFTVTLGGATTYNCATYSVPGSTGVAINGINNFGIVVGAYVSSGTTHGFIANPSAGTVQTVDYPASMNTRLLAINNNGVATGEYNFNPPGIYSAPPVSSLGWFTVDSTGTFKTLTVPSPNLIWQVGGINDSGAIAVVIGNPGPPQTFAILNPDGTLTAVPGLNMQAENLPGALNNSFQMMESDYTFGQTALANSSGFTPINVSSASEQHSYAFGLNNLGMVAGYFSPNFAGNPPDTGFTRDASGTYSKVYCPGIPFNSPNNTPLWGAIDDGGVLVGNLSSPPVPSAPVYYIATPVPGQAQLSLSTNNLVFPSTPVGQPTPPQAVMLTNTGNARLDIAGIVSSAPLVFHLSGCPDPTTQTASIQPGATCTMTVTATPNDQAVIGGSIEIVDSLPGAPQAIGLSVTGTAPPPSCQISSVTSTLANFTMQDTNSGLSSIAQVDSSNANVTIPSFPIGTTNPVTVTASQIESGNFSKVDFKATNVAGGATSCGATFGGPMGWTGIGGSFTGKIVTVTNTDGRLQDFVRGTDNALWTIGQNSPDSGWTSWQSLGGVITSDPSVAVNVAGRLEAFAMGADGALWHIWQTSAGGPWSGWESLGGTIVSDPAAISNHDGRLEVFVLGTDQALWHIWQISAGGSWSDWESLEGRIVSNPTVVMNTDGRLEAFVVGTDHALWHIVQTAANSGWGGWSSLGGSLTGDPAPVVNQDGRLEVFARGSDNQLWHVWQTMAAGSWVPFSALGGVLTSNPGIGMNGDGRLEAFVRGTDNGLWHIGQTASNSGWGDWVPLGGVLANGPTAGLNQDGRLEAFAEGTDTSLWYIEQAATGFWN